MKRLALCAMAFCLPVSAGAAESKLEAAIRDYKVPPAWLAGVKSELSVP